MKAMLIGRSECGWLPANLVAFTPLLPISKIRQSSDHLRLEHKCGPLGFFR